MSWTQRSKFYQSTVSTTSKRDIWFQGMSLVLFTYLHCIRQCKCVATGRGNIGCTHVHMQCNNAGAARLCAQPIRNCVQGSNPEWNKQKGDSDGTRRNIVALSRKVLRDETAKKWAHSHIIGFHGVRDCQKFRKYQEGLDKLRKSHISWLLQAEAVT